MRFLLAAAILLAITIAEPAPARAQGTPGGYAPERGVRLPTQGKDPELGTTGDRLRDARLYQEGQLIPPGYEVVTTYHGPLFGTGVALFGFHWILGVVLSQTDFRLGLEETARDEARNNPLMAPLVGPFITLGTEDGRPSAEIAVLVLDGVAQVGSLAMAMAGLVLKRKWVMRVEESEVGVRAGPGAAYLDVSF